MSARKVVVVGAGIIGLFCAWRLARRGARVTLLEGEKEDWSGRGPAASLAAAGMLAPISETETGHGEHDGLGALGLASFELWREQARVALFSDGVRFDGAAVAARDAADAERIAAKAEALGRRAAPLTRAHWRKRTGLRAPVEHALFMEDEGIADPQRVMSGLAMEARRHGALLDFSHDVETIEPGRALRVVCYDHMRYEADCVVLAPGVWAHETLMEVAPALKHVRPAKGHMVPVATEDPLRCTIRAPDFYLAPRGGDVALGATMEFGRYDRRVERARVEQLLQAAERTLPGLVRAREDVPAWAGVRPMSPDFAPLIGPSGRALVCCGHSRNGWLLAPISAEIICAYVFEEALPPLWAAFSPQRFLPLKGGGDREAIGGGPNTDPLPTSPLKGEEE